MATGLQEFRTKFPQYDDLTDDELAERLYQTHYSDYEPAAFRAKLGLPPLSEPEPVDELDQRLHTAQPTDPLSDDVGLDDFATQPRDPEHVPYDDWEAADRPGLISNSLRLAAEDGSKLLGHALGHAGKIGRRLEQAYPLGEIVFGTDWGPDDPADGKFRVRYMTPDEFTALKQRTDVYDHLVDRVPEFLASADFGGETRNTPEQIKEAWDRGDISDTIGATLKFSAEQGIRSLPDMIAVMAGLPGLTAYVFARADEIGETRAENKAAAGTGDGTHTLEDNLEALPWAIGSAALERFGADRVFGAFGRETAEQVGQDLLEEGIKAVAKRIGKKAGKATVAEGGTEFLQEGMLEYLAEKLGTGAELSLEEAGERGFFGMLAGSTFGGSVGGAGGVTTEVLRAMDQRILTRAQPTPIDENAPDTDFDDEGNVVPTEPDAGDAPIGADPNVQGPEGRPAEGYNPKPNDGADGGYPLADVEAWTADADFRERGGRFVWMTIKEFLDQAPPLDRSDAGKQRTEENIDDLVNHMQDGGTLDPLTITPDGKADGRHRAWAAAELGYSTVPVLDFRPLPEGVEADPEPAMFPVEPDSGQIEPDSAETGQGEDATRRPESPSEGDTGPASESAAEEEIVEGRQESESAAADIEQALYDARAELERLQEAYTAAEEAENWTEAEDLELQMMRQRDRMDELEVQRERDADALFDDEMAAEVLKEWGESNAVRDVQAGMEAYADLVGRQADMGGLLTGADIGRELGRALPTNLTERAGALVRAIDETDARLATNVALWEDMREQGLAALTTEQLLAEPDGADMGEVFAAYAEQLRTEIRRDRILVDSLEAELARVRGEDPQANFDEQIEEGWVREVPTERERAREIVAKQAESFFDAPLPPPGGSNYTERQAWFAKDMPLLDRLRDGSLAAVMLDEASSRDLQETDKYADRFAEERTRNHADRAPYNVIRVWERKIQDGEQPLNVYEALVEDKNGDLLLMRRPEYALDLDYVPEPPVVPEEEATVLDDPRMRRQMFRRNLAGMADDVIDWKARGMSKRGSMSIQPGWFVELDGTEYFKGLTKQSIEKAVDKALTGGRLGVKQEALVAEMLDIISQTRRNAVATARGRLEAARIARGLNPDGTEGERLDEGEYPADLDAIERMAFELAAEVVALNPTVAERVTFIIDNTETPQEAMAQLEGLREKLQTAPDVASAEEAAAQAGLERNVTRINVAADPIAAGIRKLLEVVKPDGAAEWDRHVDQASDPDVDAPFAIEQLLGILANPNTAGDALDAAAELAAFQTVGADLTVEEMQDTLAALLRTNMGDEWGTIITSEATADEIRAEREAETFRAQEFDWLLRQIMENPGQTFVERRQQQLDTEALEELTGADVVVDRDPVTLEDFEGVKYPAGQLGEFEVSNAVENARRRHNGDRGFEKGYREYLYGFTVAEFHEFYMHDDPEVRAGWRAAQADEAADAFNFNEPSEAEPDAGRRQTERPVQVERRQGERRVDIERRQRLEAMTYDEITAELYTDPLTGLGNRRAFNEELDLADWSVVSIDVDGLSGVNDHIGHDAGDALLQAVGAALDEATTVHGGIPFHISGDEFYILAEDSDVAQAASTEAQAQLLQQVLELEKGKLEGINITVGIGETKAQADAAMEANKKSREAEGKRNRKGELPPGGVVYSSRIDSSWKPGGSYVGDIGKHGKLPQDPYGNYQLGNGRVVRIPEKPIRRRQIMNLLQRRFGNKIYEGRVKGKTRLGFYRTNIGEIRIKNKNDLEVTAHEVAHWLDDRHPWISALYKRYRDEMKGVSYDEEKIFEGYAEFMRLFMTQDHAARQNAPGFYDAWMAALDDHPKLRDTVYELQERMHAWYLQGAKKRLQDKYGRSDTTLTERFHHAFDKIADKFLQKIFDELRSFKRAERDIRGHVASAAISGYKQMRLARGLNGVMQSIMHRGTIAWAPNGDLVFNGKGLKAIFDPVSDAMTEMQMYMIARRGQELMAQGRENLLRPDEISAGLALAEQDPRLADVFDEWLAFNERMLDFYQQSGILSRDSRKAIAEMNQNYVPFNRVVDTLRGEKPPSKGGQPFVRLRGGTGNINDVFESIVGNTTHLVHMSLVNRAKLAFYNMIMTTDNQTAGLYAVPIGKDVKPNFVDKEQVLKAFVEGMGLDMGWYRMAKTGLVGSEQEAALVQLVDAMAENMDDMVMFWQFGVDPKGDVDFVYDEGNKRFFEIGDPLLMESINHVGPRAHNLAAAILGGFSNALRRGVTLTPTFQAKNFIRDTMNAFTLSKGKIVPAVAATKALLERIYNDEHYWEYMLNGGGFASMADADGINVDRILDTRSKVLDFYDSTLAAFEYANRIAEFKTLREKGWTARDAALAGREISSDFAMRGSSEILRWITISKPFLNARLQGLYRNSRELAMMRGNRPQFLGAQAFSYAMRSLISLTIPTFWLYMMNRDDERYRALPEWVKDLSWVIFYGPGEDDYVMLPKPFETGMLWATVPERMLQYMEDNDEKELVDALLWMAMETFNLEITPQVYQPWRELEQNKNFTGAPIIPEYLKDVEPAEQYRKYTSDAMIALGRKYNISPLKAEHLVRGYFGTLGAWALDLADALVGDINNSGEKPTRGWKDSLLMSPFFNDGPLRRTKMENDLYDVLKESREVVNTVRIITKRSPERLEGYVSQAEKEILQGANEALEGFARSMRQINNTMDRIQADPDMDGDTKRAELHELRRARNEIAKAAHTYINAHELQRMIDDAEEATRRAEAAARATGTDDQ